MARLLLLALLVLALWRYLQRRMCIVDPVFTHASEGWRLPPMDDALWVNSPSDIWTAVDPLPPGTLLRRVVDGWRVGRREHG